MTDVKLTDCYTQTEGPALIGSMQVLVRMLLEQARIDREAGLNTRGLVSGYPGSPLAGLDLELSRAKRFLEEEGVVFQPAVNEELAATALYGSQHIGFYDDTDVDGVFSLWYGKGPGLDRAMDALRHANNGGVAAKGGMVVVVGDDPMGKSSTIAYQSGQNFISLGMPFFFPKSLHEIIPMGLEAFALSRYSGLCVGIKISIDIADSSVVMDMGSIRSRSKSPDADPGPVHLGRHETALVREDKHQNIRLSAVAAWQRENPAHFAVVPPGAEKTRLAIIAVGQSVPKAREALILLGFGPSGSKDVSLVEIGMPWPLATEALVPVLEGAEEILVVEEKQALVEDQIARLLVQEKLVRTLSGKTEPDGEPLLPLHGEITIPAIVDAVAARASGLRIPVDQPAIPAGAATGNLPAVTPRMPYFCAGCPHNSSTKLPDGAIGGTGIGCHTMAAFVDPERSTNFVQMGGEGAFWIGRAPFSSHDHAFQNMGDGTYAHSGSLGIRAAVAAGVNITFKLLYNGAVAMTGGQSAQGGLGPDGIARQFANEGVSKVVVVGDDPEGVRRMGEWPEGCEFHHRRDVVQVQEDLARTKGVTGMIYVQTCATELRRGRKRGRIPDREERLFINDAVCEGCGDCAVKSNCVAVKPVMRPEGEKKQIDQTLCNKDYSCLEGFCPSFVAVVPAEREEKAAAKLPGLPAAALPDPGRPGRGISNVFIAGVGGTGVMTLSAVVVMAARLEGIAAQAVTQTGLSQKNGGVTSQVRLSADNAPQPDGRKNPLDGRTVRLPPGSADLLLGCDALVAASDAALDCLDRDRSLAIVNARIDPVGVAGVGPGHVVQDQLVLKRLSSVLGDDRITLLNTSVLSERLLGSSTFANVMLLGSALQRGFLPVAPASVERALSLNGVEVDKNVAALNWGRWLVEDEAKVLAAAGYSDKEPPPGPAPEEMSADEAVEYFAARLVGYDGGPATADRYRKTILGALEAMGSRGKGEAGATAARVLYRAMAIKDEYEVARLMTDPAFEEKLREAFGTARPAAYHLAPPMLGWLRNRDGRPRKIRFGAWMRWPFLLLRSLRFLRGTPFDPFGYTAERRRERAFRERVVGMLGDPELLADPKRLDEVLEILSTVRGYGHVKEAAMDAAEQSLDAMAGEPAAEPLSKAG